jgi:hypothetical protein
MNQWPGKEFIFILNHPERYIKGKVLSVALNYSCTVFTEGKTIGFTRDDILGYGEDESELLYEKGTPEQLKLQEDHDKMEMILLHAIQKNNIPLVEYISNRCDVSFMYKKEKGTAIEIALDKRREDIVRLLLEKHAAFSNRDFLKMAIRKYPYPLHMFNVSKMKNLSQLFLGYTFREEDDISTWDVSNVENMSDLFYDSTFHGDISTWDVSKVKNMNSMFCKSEFDGDISTWDVSNVEYMSGMFADTDFDGDISQWNVSHVKNMSGMFLNSIFQGDLSQWDVSQVKNMNGMFEHSLFQGDLSSWNVSNVLFMQKMFHDSDFDGDISRWDVSKVTDMRQMFADSPFQQDISSWNANGKKENMFTHCPIPEYFKPTYKPFVPGLRSKIGAGRRTRKVF